MMALRFTYQTALAIEYLHRRNMIHRDIKPENILFDRDFNIKLCDFGWSCESNDKIRQSICGTYEYMSPEIIYLGKHDQKIDIWCLGILLYEMLHGFPPFQASNMMEMKQQFQTKHILIKKSLSKDIKDLVKFILKSQYKQRPDIQQVLQHQTFQKNLKQFQKPLTNEEKQLLAKNFMINSADGRGRTLPLIVEQLQNRKIEKEKQTQARETIQDTPIKYHQQYNFDGIHQNNNIQQNSNNVENKISQNNLNYIQKPIVQNNNGYLLKQDQINKVEEVQDNQSSQQSYYNSNYSLQSLQFMDQSFSSKRFQLKNKIPELKQLNNPNKNHLDLKQNYHIKPYQSEMSQNKTQKQKHDFYKKPSAYNYLEKEKVQSVVYNFEKNDQQKTNSYNLYNKRYFMPEEPLIDVKKVNLYSQTLNKEQNVISSFKKENQFEDSFMSDQDSIIAKTFGLNTKKQITNDFMSPYQIRQRAQSEKNVIDQVLSPNSTVKRYKLNDLSSITSSLRSIETLRNYDYQSPRENQPILEHRYYSQSNRNVIPYKAYDNISQNKNDFKPNYMTSQNQEKEKQQNSRKTYESYNRTDNQQQRTLQDNNILKREEHNFQRYNSNTQNNSQQIIDQSQDHRKYINNQQFQQNLQEVNHAQRNYNKYQKNDHTQINNQEQYQQYNPQNQKMNGHQQQNKQYNTFTQQKIEQQPDRQYSTINRVRKDSYLSNYVQGSINSMRSITSYQQDSASGKVRKVTRIKL